MNNNDLQVEIAIRSENTSTLPRSVQGIEQEEEMCMVRNKPTTEQWNACQHAWSWFNDELFDGKLESCILNFSRKTQRICGFFSPERWSKDEHTVPEISLNPDQLKTAVYSSISFPTSTFSPSSVAVHTDAI